MAFATTNTLMPIDTWADLMELDPLVFNGAYADGCSEYFVKNDCDGLWPQHRWQSYTNASREDLARAILSAETSIESAINTPNRAKEITDIYELSDDEKYDLFAGRSLRIKTSRNNIIVGGRFVYDRLGNYAVVIDLTQPAFDSFMATVTVPIRKEELLDLKQYELYYPGFVGESGYKISIEHLEYDDVLEELTFYVRTWNLLNIDKLNAPPRTPANSYDRIIGIDMCDSESYQTTVDVATVSVSSPLNDGVSNASIILDDGETCDARLVILDNENGYVEVTLDNLTEVNPEPLVIYDDNDPVYPEQQIAFSLLAQNTGTVDAHNVVIRDTLPADTTLVRVLDGGYYEEGTNECVWEVDNIPANGEVTVRMVVKVDRDAAVDIVNDIYSVASGYDSAAGDPVTILLAPGAEVLSIGKTYTFNDIDSIVESNKYEWGGSCASAQCDGNAVAIKLSYIAGCTTDGTVYGPGCYDNEVAMIAVARIARDVCTCGCGNQTRVEDYRADWSIYDGTIARRILSSDILNPFGTRGGEILAWRRLAQIAQSVKYAGLV